MSVKTVIVSARSGVRILYLHSETPGNGGFCTASDKKCPNTIFGKNLIFLRIKRDVFLLSSNTPFFKSIKIIDDNFLVIRMITYLHKTCCHGQKEENCSKWLMRLFSFCKQRFRHKEQLLLSVQM